MRSRSVGGVSEEAVRNTAPAELRHENGRRLWRGRVRGCVSALEELQRAGVALAV